MKVGGPYSKYFQDKVGPNEKLIANSYRLIPNNRGLDNRVRTFMRTQELTVCETVYPYGKIPKTPFWLLCYAVNYSFDNYETFGFITKGSWTKFDAATYNNRGVMYLQNDDNDKAIADFTQVIKFNSNSAGAYGDRGIAYCNKGDFNQANTDFTRALKLDPYDADIFYNRGEGYQATDDYERAEADNNHAISLDPIIPSFKKTVRICKR
jgi:tetratricopeptide (TPR) repeat protein